MFEWEKYCREDEKKPWWLCLLLVLLSQAHKFSVKIVKFKLQLYSIWGPNGIFPLFVGILNGFISAKL